jgi:hypothetical protein
MKLILCSVVAAVVAAGCASVSPALPALESPASSRADAGAPLASPTAELPRARDAAIHALAMAPLTPQDLREVAPRRDAEVVVAAPRDTGYGEERLVGSNEQPEWTTRRRFATTRAYVLAPGQIEVEQWYKLKTPRGSGPIHFWQTEIGMGFEGGWQLDLYENYGREPHGPTKHQGVQVEGRYALGKWGEIPLNPTLYGEYVFNHDAADKVEAKLLLSDDLCRGWHWAGNLIWEQETSGERETEYAASLGISHVLLDSRLSLGVEGKAEWVTANGSRGDPEHEFLVGPSVQWRPTENTHLDVVPLFGFSKSDRRDPRFELFVVFGIDFGPDHGRSGTAPASTRSR